METPMGITCDKHNIAHKTDHLASQLSRDTLSYLEKFDRYDSQELLACASSNWLLSNEDFRLSSDPPAGMISQVNLESNECVILLPEAAGMPALTYKELHTIVRELTYGLYIMHQTPSVSLETNFDQSSSCQLPPAYLDTLVGQALVNVDFMVKCLWHGAYVPREKRAKFMERWRTNVDINHSGKPEIKKTMLPEFTGLGLHDITKDPDLADAYSKAPSEHPLDPMLTDERRFFMSHVDSLSMRLIFFQRSVKNHRDMFVIDADYSVSSVVRLLEDNVTNIGYERIKRRLRVHEDLIEKNLPKKLEIRRHLELLRFISYMTPFLMAMKKHMKIPDMSRLLDPLCGDDCRTERELPPLMVGPDFKCKNFFFGDTYFNLHGGINLDLEAGPLKNLGTEFAALYNDIRQHASDHLQHLLSRDSSAKDDFTVPSYVISGKKYLVILVEFEAYYGNIPHKPMWVRSFHAEMIKLKAKRLPIADMHIQEQFKKYFGYKKSVKFKTPVVGMKAAAQRGMVAMFQTLCRKLPCSRLAKHDEHGLNILHHATINNRPHIVGLLILQSMNVNMRRNNIVATAQEDPQGLTALHMGSRCGSLDAVECLLSYYADVRAVDHDGWAPIHHAAYFDHQHIVGMMVRRHPSLLELPTKNQLKRCALLLAAWSGSLSVVKCLIDLDVDIQSTDTEGNNLVTLAALRLHVNVLEFLIDWNNPKIRVWNLLVGMLCDDSLAKKESAVKCLESLANSNMGNWQAVLASGAIPAVVKLLELDSLQIQSVAAAVLCSISEHKEIRQALTDAQAGPILIKRLESHVADIQSRAAIILSDLAYEEGNQDMIANSGGVQPLVNLLNCDLEDVLVNTVNAVRVLCSGNQANQTAVAECGVAEPLVEFLTVASDDLQAGTAAAIVAVCKGHRRNQDAIIAQGAARPLVDLIRGSRSITVQMKAAWALEALAQNNPNSQQRFLELDAPKALIRLLKNMYTDVREQGAAALWSLAGHTRTQQKYIAKRISIPLIIQMLLEPSWKLLHVGCMMAIAMGRESTEYQNKLAEADAFQQLVRLLRQRKQNESVLLMVIKVIGTLCIGVAYRNNPVTQRRVSEEGGVQTIVDMLMDPPSEDVQAQLAITLGCVVLSNRQNQERLQDELHFKFDILLNLLRSSDKDVRLSAAMALAIFAFNNIHQQFAISEAGGIAYSVFEPFLNSDNEFHQCYAAFQVVVLSRVIVGHDQVWLTAQGVRRLLNNLRSNDDKVLVLACSLLSSLAHTRAGITDAMVTDGAVDLLVDHLLSNNDQVRNGAAVALGYLTYNKTAARLMFSVFRNYPSFFSNMMTNIGEECHLNPQFVQDFEHAKAVGLPSQCLEINGGPLVKATGKGNTRSVSPKNRSLNAMSPTSYMLSS